MNVQDRQLERLLRAAAQAPKALQEPPVLSWKTEAQVLSAWRLARQHPLRESWTGLFRIGVAFAGAAALVTVLLAWPAGLDAAPDEVAATHAEFNVAVLR